MSEGRKFLELWGRLTLRDNLIILQKTILMGTIILTIISIVTGAIASYWSSRIFFRRGLTKKEITPYLHFSTKIFSGIEPNLKRNLEITYKGVKVTNLYQVQFLIANTGSKPIRDFIQPLSVEIDEGLDILDAEIIDVYPEGREIKFNQNKNRQNKVDFIIPLLDCSEFFIIKFLLKDSEEIIVKDDKKSLKESFRFSVSLDELPPILKIEQNNFNSKNKRRRSLEGWEMFLTSIFGIANIFVLIVLGKSDGNYFIFNTDVFFRNFNFFKICILINWIQVLIIVVALILYGIGSLMIVKSKGKPKFIIPESLLNKYR